MIRHLFSWEGRIARGEYAISYIAYWIYAYQVHFSLDFFFAYFLGLIMFTAIIMGQAAKRCHDLGRPGWFQFIPFYFLWLLAKRGEKCGNQYGDYIE